jgi:hypothetical protein
MPEYTWWDVPPDPRDAELAQLREWKSEYDAAEEDWRQRQAAVQPSTMAEIFGDTRDDTISELKNELDWRTRLVDLAAAKNTTLRSAVAKAREALEQIEAVCKDNEPQTCAHEMALKFVHDVALAALDAAEKGEAV